MSATDDRYRVSEGSMTSLPEEPISLDPAGRGRRFANYLIDTVAQVLLVAVLSAVSVVIWGESSLAWMETTPDIVFGLGMMFLYYVPMEGLTGRTIGKFITRTVVVDEEGQRPSLGQVLGRTLARIVPFEAFSFFSSDARGWHDSWPRTYVVIKR